MTSDEPLFASFDVVGVNEGIMIHCRRCGVHNWREGNERELTEIIREAAAHREICHAE